MKTANKPHLIPHLMQRIPVLAGIAMIAIAPVSCHRYDASGYKFDNSLYIDVSATSQIQTKTFSSKTDAFDTELSAVLAYPSEKDVNASLLLDVSLVEDYNRTYGTDYEMLPERYHDFTQVEIHIPAGKTASSPVTIAFKGLIGEGEQQTGALELDKSYLFPVRIVSDNMKVMDISSIAYYIVRRSSAVTTAAELTDNWINFPLLDSPGPVADAYNGLSAMTYESLVYIDRFDLSNGFGDCAISTVMGVEEYMLLRIGDTNFERQQLQFSGGAVFGKFPKSDASKKLETGQWYHLAATYDSDTRTVRIYVNGKIQSEADETGNLPDGGMNFAMRAMPGAAGDERQFFIGYSYNDFRPLQGKIAEARVWSVARTPEQIWENMYRIKDPENHPELIGYWKFDEGQGNEIKDWSIYGNHGVSQKNIIWPEGIEIPEINK
ncbi:MAG: DUF1735 and LamG domain-containing protein [Bacteroidales bacterium]|nr:DUF1735 and LamG domain-containing protein [Bacteroidales bacterium]